MKRALGLVAGTVFGVALVANCGTGGVVGEMADLLGVDVKDAHAATPTMVACDKARIWTAVNGNNVTRTTTYFAEVDAPGISGAMAPNIRVSLCGYEYFGSTVDSFSIEPCPMGSSCTTMGYNPSISTLTCTSGSGARFGGDKVVVICGYKQEWIDSATPANNRTSGQRSTVAYVAID